MILNCDDNEEILLIIYASGLVELFREKKQGDVSLSGFISANWRTATTGAKEESFLYHHQQHWHCERNLNMSDQIVTFCPFQGFTADATLNSESLLHFLCKIVP